MIPFAVGTPPSAVTRAVIGHSVRGRALIAIHAGARDSARRLLVVGCIHGNETAGRVIARRLASTSARAGAEVWVVVDANPDGAERGTRQNARGVDLNRNFPSSWRHSGSPFSTFYSGPRPVSEPESRALARLIRRVRPDVTVYYHQHMNVVALPPGGGAGAAAVRRYARLTGMRAADIGARHGSAAGWQRNALHEPASFVVELPAGRLSATAVRRHAAAALAVTASQRV